MGQAVLAGMKNLLLTLLILVSVFTLSSVGAQAHPNGGPHGGGYHAYHGGYYHGGYGYRGYNHYYYGGGGWYAYPGYYPVYGYPVYPTPGFTVQIGL
jgi:hypothetical protein